MRCPFGRVMRGGKEEGEGLEGGGGGEQHQAVNQGPPGWQWVEGKGLWGSAGLRWFR